MEDRDKEIEGDDFEIIETAAANKSKEMDNSLTTSSSDDQVFFRKTFPACKDENLHAAAMCSFWDKIWKIGHLYIADKHLCFVIF